MSMFKPKMLSDTSEDDTDNDHDMPKKAPSFRAAQVPRKPAAYSMPKLGGDDEDEEDGGSTDDWDGRSGSEETGKSKRAPCSGEDSESDDSDAGNVINTWSQSGSRKVPGAASKKRKDFAQGGAESKHMRLSSSFSNDDDEPAEGSLGKKRNNFAQGGSESKRMKYSTSLSNDDEPAESSSGVSMGNYSNISQKLMLSMGYKAGAGLGKNNQGIADIIPTSKQRGRRGLGLSLEGLEPSADVKWDFEKEEVDVKERVDWIPECEEEPPNIKTLREWVAEGKKKLTIDDETCFCDEKVLKQIIDCKSVFDRLEPEEMRRARTRSNPFETIRGGIFLNRAAMKMANMDSAFDFMFTSPVDENGVSMVGPDDLLYFADVCAGPGGFSEYVLWRKGWQAKGFGFTLKGPNDFKLEDFFAGSPDTFEPLYGVTGDGDIFIPDNIRYFSKAVKLGTDNQGVHFVMADGGFSVEGQENIQEILSKQLYLCQFYAALSVLRTGGHFVCKLFDIFTVYSVGLVYLMYRAFRHVSIFKPNTSRPANSERYIVCKWRRPDTKDIEDYMYELCCRFKEISSVTSQDDIVEVVPLEVLNDDAVFAKYIRESNDRLGRAQITHLTKIRAFAQNSELYEERQSSLRKECLKEWKVPDLARLDPKRPPPESKFKELTKNEVSYFERRPEELTPKFLEGIKSLHDYRCIVCGEWKPGVRDNKFLFLSAGRKQVYQWTGSSADQWKKVTEGLELPPDTLFYGEMVQEFAGEGRQQKRFNTIHIIDALVLGKVPVKDKHYEERMKWVQKFVKALSKPSRNDLTPLRAKEVFKLPEVESLFERISWKQEKGASRNMRLSCTVPQEQRDREERHFSASGVLFYRTTKEPWHEEYSTSSQRRYYYNTMTRKSDFEMPKYGCAATFRDCFQIATLWSWTSNVQIMPTRMQSEECPNDGKVHRTTLVNFVRKRLGK
ncbi:cap methyltransferase 1 isoform X1 [Rhipicephalus microplus]|uniref:cap methyltransferase 1 isoform X1 n=1 Tax=Rhipicephalus microplus TaxID=6941 RepID=UPI003F6A5525